MVNYLYTKLFYAYFFITKISQFIIPIKLLGLTQNCKKSVTALVEVLDLIVLPYPLTSSGVGNT